MKLGGQNLGYLLLIMILIFVGTIFTTKINGKSIVMIDKHTNANIAPQKLLDAQHIESRFGIQTHFVY